MRFSIITFSLHLMITGVLCNPWSGPYESTLMWYAYRMDVLANDVDDRTLLKGSTHKASGPGKPKTFLFDEFLDAIKRDVKVSKSSKEIKKWTGNTGVGTELEPTVEAATKGISDTGKKEGGKPTDKYSNMYDARKIFPADYAKLEKGTAPSFDELFGKVFDNIKANRAKISGANKAKFDTALSRAQETSEGMHATRAADTAEKQIAHMNDLLTKNGISGGVKIKKEKRMNDRIQWDAINNEATLDAYPDSTVGVNKAFREFNAAQGDVEGKPKHQASLDFVQAAASELTGKKCI
ncbi:hypothetical protein N7456_006715 [Penicillium angulare]|uniref:Uncharacterized protein n=1 Tax=Penicillium angulare TaxID=116970 RepID=A0A9W9KC78_9EURO|nr:hypothetical protein N7456_006715 [Penicillium angulare]